MVALSIKPCKAFSAHQRPQHLLPCIAFSAQHRHNVFTAPARLVLGLKPSLISSQAIILPVSSGINTADVGYSPYNPISASQDICSVAVQCQLLARNAGYQRHCHRGNQRRLKTEPIWWQQLPVDISYYSFNSIHQPKARQCCQQHLKIHPVPGAMPLKRQSITTWLNSK